LRVCAILDTPPEERFNRHTRLAQRLLNVPIALVSLVDHERQWFKSHAGLAAVETAREVSFCAHAIHTPRKLMVVEDASLDGRFLANPLVVGPPDIRFYAGCPLLAEDGSALGTFCVIDSQPRGLDDRDAALLADLAALVEKELRGELADTVDALTGLSNRKGFALSAGPLMQLFSAATLVHVELSSDADRDVVHIAHLLNSTWPRASVIARVAEREFAVVLVGDDATEDTQDLRTALASTRFDVTIHRALVDRTKEPPLQVVDRRVLSATEGSASAPDWQCW
jgi:GGDEF domain-containing protein